MEEKKEIHENSNDIKLLQEQVLHSDNIYNIKY